MNDKFVEFNNNYLKSYVKLIYWLKFLNRYHHFTFGCCRFYCIFVFFTGWPRVCLSYSVSGLFIFKTLLCSQNCFLLWGRYDSLTNKFEKDIHEGFAYSFLMWRNCCSTTSISSLSRSLHFSTSSFTYWIFKSLNSIYQVLAY